MKKSYLSLLGKRVLPIVKPSQYQASNWDINGNLSYLQGEDRLRYAKRVVDKATADAREMNKNQEWTVWAVKADGTFDLLSDYGYEQNSVSRSDFRLIN